MKTKREEIANTIYQILHKIYVESRPHFEQFGKEEGCTLEQTAAMAITSMLMERFFGGGEGEPQTNDSTPS